MHAFQLQVQFLDMVLDMPVVVLRQVPGLATIETPQLLFGHGGLCPYDAGRAGFHPCCGAGADSHGLDCSAVHSSSPVAWTRWSIPPFAGVQVVDIPVVTQRLFPMVQVTLQTIVIPQLQSTDKVVDVPVCRSAVLSGAVCEKTVEIPQLQHVEAWTFGRALCTGTRPGLTPAHQGGEGVAGSPGV